MPTHSHPPVTVSVVSHRQEALVAPLLGQLARYCAPLIDQVLLTVNVADDEPPAPPPSGLRVHRIRNPHPRGFGANHNAAFAHCATDWFLVLNPDIRLVDDAIGALLQLARDETALLAPRILEPGKAAPEPHRALITPWEIVARHRRGYRPPREPSWIPGMFMLLRSAAYRQVGGFDARYFMYGEDFDLCARLGLAGWNMQVAEQLLVRHEAQRASHRDWRHLLWHFRSLARVWSSGAFWRYRAMQPSSRAGS